MLTTFGFDPFSDPEELDGPAHEEGCAFLVERGVEVPTSAVTVVERARAAHPDVNAWVYGRLKS